MYCLKRNSNFGINKFKTYYVDKNIILFLFIFLIVIGKIIRYTIMKTVLVDAGIGYSWIELIANGDLYFNFVTIDNAIASENVIYIFSKLNIFGLQTYLEFEIAISVIFNIITFVFLLKMKKNIKFTNFIFICMSIIALNIFDFTLAKEPLQMIFFFICSIILLNSKLNAKNKIFLIVFVLSFSALILRIYYLIIVSFFLIIIFIYKFIISKTNINNTKKIIISLFLIFISYLTMLVACKYLSPSSYEALLYVRTRSSSATTDMLNITNSDNVLMLSIEYIIMAARMLFPIELITYGPKYWVYVIYQLFISFVIINKLLTTKKNYLSICLFVAFVLGSATFEPDFGSWVRHETVLMPVFLVAIDCIQVNSRAIARKIKC